LYALKRREARRTSGGAQVSSAEELARLPNVKAFGNFA
jgi:hypothetical protein